MSMEDKLILNLLSDDRIKNLLSNQDRAYWESLITVFEQDADQKNDSLVKLTFLLSMYALSNPQQLEISDWAYKLLKTLSVDDGETLREWNDLASIPTKDEYLSYYFFLCSIALQKNKTISARLTLSKYQEQENDESDWGERVLTDILRSTLYLVRKHNGYEDIRKVIRIIDSLQKEQDSFEAEYLNTFNANQQTAEALWLVALYHTSKAVVETAQYILQG